MASPTRHLLSALAWKSRPVYCVYTGIQDQLGVWIRTQGSRYLAGPRKAAPPNQRAFHFLTSHSLKASYSRSCQSLCDSNTHLSPHPTLALSLKETALFL